MNYNQIKQFASTKKCSMMIFNSNHFNTENLKNDISHFLMQEA